MKSSLAIGVILMLLGAAMLAWPVITYRDTETIVDFGSIEVTDEDTRQVALPPVLGSVMIATGLAVVVFGGRRLSV